MLNRIKKVSYQGEPGSNSSRALQQLFPEAEQIPCVTFDSALDHVIRSDTDATIVPIENSIGGRVADLHYLLPSSNLKISHELFLPIEHYLMAKKGAKLSDLNIVRSHIQALAQCRNFIKKLNLTPVAGIDTAGCARQISETNQINEATLAPLQCAELYNLEVLSEKVDFTYPNVTRFIVLQKKLFIPTLTDDDFVSAIIFETPNVPAALFKALCSFATNGINLTKLESYHEDATMISTKFYVEIDCHIEKDIAKIAIKDLEYQCHGNLNIIGVFPAHSYRKINPCNRLKR